MTTFKEFLSEISEKKQLTEKVIFLRLKLINPSQINFTAGQFITVKLSENLRRSYSIYNPPFIPPTSPNSPISQSLDLVVDTSPGGEGSKFFENSAVGQKIDFLGPLGKFTFQKNPEIKNVCFVATGTGVAPIHSMIMDISRRGAKTAPLQKITLLYGVSYFADLINPEEYLSLQEKFPNFKFVPCISREEKEDCFSGRVTDFLLGTNPPPNSQFYICGQREMVADVIKILKEKDIPSSFIFTEQF